MKEKFPAVFALLGVEEMQMQEGGAFMNEGLLATLNAAIEAKEKAAADAQALVESLTQEKENLTQQVADLNSQAETLNTEHAQTIENLNSEHATAIEEKDNAIAALEQEKADLQTKIDENATNMETMQNELNGAKESLTTAENTLAERDQQITDLNAQLTELQNNAGAEPQAGAAPQNNGGGAEAPELVVNRYVFDKNLSYEENCRAEEEWNKAHGK